MPVLRLFSLCLILLLATLFYVMHVLSERQARRTRAAHH